MPTSLRDHKKAATRRALVDAALQRFYAQGFDATTLDEVCQDAGVARRTFFRYFDSKESLVFPHRAERLQRFVELLEATPADQSPLGSLRTIAQIFAKEYSQHRRQLIARQRLIDAVPALRAREREIDEDWEQAMALAFHRYFQHAEASKPASKIRAHSSKPELKKVDLRARVLAGAAIGVIRATMQYWFDHNGRPDLGDLGARALDHLEQGFMRSPSSPL